MYRIPLALVALVLIILGAFLYREHSMLPRYESEEYGFSFTYPEEYVLTEEEVGSGYYSIRLTRGEGPTAITIDVYSTELTSLLEWVTTVNASNFHLGTKTYEPTTVATVPALHYRWSGLYEGETTAFLHNGRVVALSATRLTPEEHTEAYEKVLSSFDLK